MTVLSIYKEDAAGMERTMTDPEAIARTLQAMGVQFERWRAERLLASDADQQQVIAAYGTEIERLSERYGFRSIDVVSLGPDHPDRVALRQKFLAEHTHDEFEIRFFVGGRGLFYLHVGAQVYLLLCEQGDLISVPAKTAHWFDMGERPNFKCIRFFTTPEGWVGRFTGSDIATRFPDFDACVAALA